MKQIITFMQTLTVRDLRYDFAKVEAWLADGQEIEITKHGKPVARLSPPRPQWWRPKFDIEAHMRWMKETWGDRVFSAEEVREMREAELGDRS
jgi:prevent-host-death family protein